MRALFHKLATIAVVLIMTSCAQRGVREDSGPKDPDSQKIIDARILHDSGEIEAAISTLRTWVDTTTYREKHDVAYELIVQWLLEVSQHDEAKRVASFFLSQHPKSPSANRIIQLFDQKKASPAPGSEPKQSEPETIEEKRDGGNPMDSVLDKEPSAALYYFHVGKFDESLKHIDKAPSLPLMAELRKEIESVRQADMKSVGVILPLTGPFAPFGKKTLAAMSIAWSLPLDTAVLPISVMKDGIRIVIVDSKGDALAAQKAVDQLVKVEKVAVIVGEITNDASLLIAQKCQQYGVPLLSLSRHPTLGSLGDYVFVVNASPKQQIERLVDYAINTAGHRHFGILFPRHNYGMSMSQLFFDEVIKKGGSVTALEAYDAHDTSFTAPVKKLVGKFYLANRPEAAQCSRDNVGKLADKCRDSIKPIVDFDALFIPEFQKLALVIPALMQEDLLISSNPRVKASLASATKIDNPHYVQLLGANSWNDKAILDKIINFIDGAYFVDSLSFEDTDELKQFATAFTNLHGQSPSTLEAFAHDAAVLAIKMLTDGPVTGRKELRERIARFKGRVGVLTNFAFMASGELDAPEAGFQIKDGVVETVVSSTHGPAA